MPATAQRVLVVEDEWFIADDYASDLNNLGLEVVGPAPTVAEAMEWLDKSDISVAVLDIGLIGDDSFELARELSKRSIPFIFISGYDRKILPPELEDRTLLSKPVPRASFRRAIESLIR